MFVFVFARLGNGQSLGSHVSLAKDPSGVVFMVSNSFMAAILSSILPTAEILVANDVGGPGCDSVGVTKSDLVKMKKSHVLIKAFEDLHPVFVSTAKKAAKVIIDLNSLPGVKNYLSSACETLEKSADFVDCGAWISYSAPSNAWIDPKFAIVAAKSLSLKLIEMFADQKVLIELRTKNTVERLSSVLPMFEALAKSKRGFFGMHDEYRYVATDYNLVYYGGVMLSDHSMSSINVAAMGALSAEKKICLFMDRHHLKHYGASGVMKRIFSMKNVRVVSVDPIVFASDLQSYIDALKNLAQVMASCLRDEEKEVSAPKDSIGIGASVGKAS